MVAGRFRIVVLADGELSVVSAAQFSYVVHIVTASAVDVDKPVGHHQARSYIYNKVEGNHVPTEGGGCGYARGRALKNMDFSFGLRHTFCNFAEQ